MDNRLKKGIIAGLVFLCAVDVVTTVIGLYAIVKPTSANPLAWVFVFAPAIAIIILLLLTDTIWRGTTGIHKGLRCFWCIGFVYDIYTSMAANIAIVIVRNTGSPEQLDVIAQMKTASPHQVIVVLVATLLISGAPILLPYVIHDKL